MVARSSAAPPTPWSTALAQPRIHETAYVHSFSNIIGDVQVGANVLVAPGTSIRADEGSPFYIGAGTNIQDGVVIHGLEQGRVMGDDQQSYSVWVGNNVSLTHKALIHGPAYIGDNCFIGFRSTVFNARIGQGCIVMMHVLIQDVEISPGKYIPSGTVITHQQQAERLPDVQPQDRKFASHVVGINESLRSGYVCAEDESCIAPRRNGGLTAKPAAFSEPVSPTYASSNSEPLRPEHPHPEHPSHQKSMNRLSTETLQQVRRLLSQGYQIGTEHVDQRRFRINSWSSCTPIHARSESEAVSALEACLAEHNGEYVRLFGIEPKGRQRIGETIIQRPGEQRQGSSGSDSRSAYSSASSHSQSSYGQSNFGQSSYSSASGGQVAPAVQQEVQRLLHQGFVIGTEYANIRQYRANSWKSGPLIQTNRVSEAIAELEAFLADHAGEYVRLCGVDPKAKQRLMEIIIQRPGESRSGGSTESSRPAYGSSTSASNSYTNGHSSYGASTSSRLDPEIQREVHQLLNQGYHLNTEFANVRQYRANTWKSGSLIQTDRASEAIAALESLMAEHEGEYVRLIGVEPKAKRRVAEKLIQHPGR